METLGTVQRGQELLLLVGFGVAGKSCKGSLVEK